MYACICFAVSEDDVTDAVLDGADTVEAVGEQTDAGTGCGSCRERLEGLIERCPLRRLAAA